MQRAMCRSAPKRGERRCALPRAGCVGRRVGKQLVVPVRLQRKRLCRQLKGRVGEDAGAGGRPQHSQAPLLGSPCQSKKA